MTPSQAKKLSELKRTFHNVEWEMYWGLLRVWYTREPNGAVCRALFGKRGGRK